ncbi:GTPase Obg [Elysia marginata]|uniref:GTPase Obg n=1 Tax=Elysia marginata TaxID=1093978 RepID=A0AAV4F043_9GAST|nr:GTPase Obg [Elysia marginata]
MYGQNGGKSRSAGADGKDTVIEVPLGTVVKDENQHCICEVSKDEEEIIIVEGGKGGKGNWHFRSSVNQTPKYAQEGLEGETKKIILELKLLADVGLVGFPNSGKSTLLSVMTSAKPKIATYEFTTLKPNLGFVKYHDFRSFVMADIPGIIEGASKGRGLGHHFLRHIERNSVLLFLVPCDASDIVKQYYILLRELEQHNLELLHKQRLLAITKSDLIDNELESEMRKEIEQKIPQMTVTFISSFTKKRITTLKENLWRGINKSTKNLLRSKVPSLEDH